jgi:hypothetical protein
MKTVIVHREDVERILSGNRGRHIYEYIGYYRAMAKQLMSRIGYGLG